jgi:hypothetical protein
MASVRTEDLFMARPRDRKLIISDSSLRTLPEKGSPQRRKEHRVDAEIETEPVQLMRSVPPRGSGRVLRSQSRLVLHAIPTRYRAVVLTSSPGCLICT